MNQPDIEIYIKNVNANDLSDWLESVFKPFSDKEAISNSLNSGRLLKLNVEYKNALIPLCITPNAAGKAFTSVWFQSELSPWSNDLECAESFLSMYENEVRCSSEGWTESEEENSEKWWCITRNERRLVRWG